MLSGTSNHIRRLTELGYRPAAIARALMLDVAAVDDFLARLKPVDGGRPPVQPGKLTRVREPSVHRASLRARARAEAKQAARLELMPAAGWTAADRFATGAAEAAAYAQFMVRVREGKLSAAELLDQAGVFYAPPRRTTDGPPPETAVWTGEENPHAGNPKLTPEILAELRVLRSQGWSTGALAKRYGVTRATICNALLNRTFREARRATSPLPFSGGIPLLLENS